jgi:protein-S-isoprenylcysteine O-methyltransferase Ste14
MEIVKQNAEVLFGTGSARRKVPQRGCGSWFWGEPGRIFMGSVQVTVFSGYVCLFLLYLFAYRASGASSARIKQEKDVGRFKYFSLYGGAILFGAIAVWAFLPNVFLLSGFYSRSSSITGFVISLFGIVFFITAKRQLGHRFSPCSRARIPDDLKTDGLYALVRHPIYTGNLIFILGVCIATGSVLALAVLGLFSFVYAKSMPREEEGLGSAFRQYSEYALRTPRIVPGTFFWKNNVRVSRRSLNTKEEYDAFNRLFQQVGGVGVDYEYLNASRVVGYYRKTDLTLIAGYVVSACDDLRYFRLLPEDELERHPFVSRHRGNFSEVTCIWMLPGLNKLEKFLFYYHSMTDAFFTGKRFILGGTNNPKIQKMQMMSLPTLLYYGTKRGADYPVWVYTNWRLPAMLRFLFYSTPLEIIRRSRVEKQKKRKYSIRASQIQTDFRLKQVAESSSSGKPVRPKQETEEVDRHRFAPGENPDARV